MKIIKTLFSTNMKDLWDILFVKKNKLKNSVDMVCYILCKSSWRKESIFLFASMCIKIIHRRIYKKLTSMDIYWVVGERR